MAAADDDDDGEDQTAAAAAADADIDALLLLRVEALLWELAPRHRIVAALENAEDGVPLPCHAQQRLLMRALAAPPPHAPLLASSPSPSPAAYPPDYLAGVLQRATAGFMRSSGGGALDEALAEMLQRVLVLPPPPRTTEAETTTAAPPCDDSPPPPDDASLLKTWCYLPPDALPLCLPALESLQAQADARRRRRGGSTTPGTNAPAAPATPAPAAAAPASISSATAGLVSLRLSPDIFAAGTGATTWHAGFVLGEWLLSRRAAPWVRGRRVLELGSGAGLAGVCAWRAGCRRLRLTDADGRALANCRRNVLANLDGEGEFDCDESEEEVVKGAPVERRDSGEGADGGRGRRSLRWLRFKWDDAPRLPAWLDGDEDEPDDLVIAADVAYDPLILPGLTRALSALLRRRRGGEGRGEGGGGGGGSVSGGVGSPRDEPFAVVATTVRQTATLALLLELAREQGLSMTAEAEWWRQRRRGRGGGAGGESDDECEEAAAVSAAEGRAWGDDPRFVSVQGLDRRGIVVHVVELIEDADAAAAAKGG